jgi:hypothetical protein
VNSRQLLCQARLRLALTGCFRQRSLRVVIVHRTTSSPYGSILVASNQCILWRFTRRLRITAQRAMFIRVITQPGNCDAASEGRHASLLSRETIGSRYLSESVAFVTARWTGFHVRNTNHFGCRRKQKATSGADQLSNGDILSCNRDEQMPCVGTLEIPLSRQVLFVISAFVFLS